MSMLRAILSLRAGLFSLLFLCFILLLAVFGPVLAPYDPLQGTASVLAGPGAQHRLGTDYLGRDVLSRILAGSTISVLGSVQVAVIAMVAGTIPGILSVYLGRGFEWLSLRLVDTVIALPFLVFAVAVTALLGNGIPQAMLVVGIMVCPAFYRVARASTLAIAHTQYVEAALLSGASLAWVVRKHVWAKVLPPIAVTLANTMGTGFVVVSSLSFIGIGVQPPAPTWGGVLASDLGYLTFRPYAPFFTISLIILTTLSFNLLADVLRDVSGESGRALLRQRARRRQEAAHE